MDRRALTVQGLRLQYGLFKLMAGNSIYQAELIAILNSLKHLFRIPVEILCLCQINLFSDSQSSIMPKKY